MRRGLLLIVLLLFIYSCNPSRYITDSDSAERQRKLKSQRAWRVTGNTFLTAGSVFVSVITGVNISFIPEGRQLRHITLHNESDNAMIVNMFTDVIWKDSIYLDFTEIQLPPGEKCRLLMPKNALYNVYFRKSSQPEGTDEWMEINTSFSRRVRLRPGMTIMPDELFKEEEEDEFPFELFENLQIN
jgi:hypothetical protein